MLTKLIFQNKSFRNTIIVSNGLDPDQDRHGVGSDLVQTVCKGHQHTTKSPLARKEIKLFF